VQPVSSHPSGSGPGPQPESRANLVVLVGQVLPMSGPRPYGQAVAIVGDRIEAVGGRDLIDAYRQRGATVLDFGERAILPGFVDPHVHLEEGSLALTQMVDCRVPRCQSVSDVLETLSQARADVPSDGWLIGQANLFWDQKLADRRFPTREELDRVSRTNPIVIRAGSHRSVLNTRAFELARPEQLGGREGLTGRAIVETDATGAPTGVVAEIDQALPMPAPDRGELEAALRQGITELFTRYGVTTVGEISNSLDGLAAADAILAAEPPIRVIVHLWSPGTLTLDEACDWRARLAFASAPEWLRVEAVKIFVDGGFSACNAATLQRYRGPHAIHPGSRGQLNLRRSFMVRAMAATHSADLQLAVHANGERAQIAICDAAVRAAAEIGATPRVRLEHGGNFLTRDTTIEAWEAAGVTALAQPGFLYNFFGDFLPDYLGPSGLHGRLPLRKLLDRGWRPAGSSDLHVGGEIGATNPLFSIWCCLQRQSFLGHTVEAEQAIGIDEALRMHTIDAAAALGEAGSRGSLEPGKLADIVVLDSDPRQAAAAALPHISVDHVFIGGSRVHSRDGAAEPAMTRPA
jgi:predicted amidohydrolase YtcJ